VLNLAGNKQVSFEVLADEFADMVRQGHEIAAWGENVLVKVPVLNSRGAFTGPVLLSLSAAGVKLNVTAVTSWPQAASALRCLLTRGNLISVFAGRIADTGRNPLEVVCETVARARLNGTTRVLWASVREAYNVVQAEEAGCDVITLTPEMIRKVDRFGTDLETVALETVRQFKLDAEGISL